MAFTNTVDERYLDGGASSDAGDNDASAEINSVTVLAPNDSAYGALIHDGAPDVDVYALGMLEHGVYTITVLNDPWDTGSTVDASVSSIALLDSSGAVLGVSTGGGLEVEVYDASEFYLRIDGGDHGAAQYRASYSRTGDLPPDHAFSEVTYTLSPMQLNLTLTGSAEIDGTGNALDNVITGNAAANTLRGEDGNDWLNGAGGLDALLGGAGDDVLGGAGVERMDGGTGDDSYLVNDARDRVVEDSNGGTDVVYAEVSHTLSAMVEELVIDTDLNVDGSGNGLSNVLSGGAGANRLWGLDGDDTLHGLAGDDRLDGGAGVDAMHGGLGDDTFVVDSSLDRVHERRSEGVDLVFSSAGFTLTDHVENLTLTGSGAIGGVGNAGANQLRGNAGDNSLRGLEGGDLLLGFAGDDLLDGGAGVDAMHGGLGDDTFVVDSSLDRVHERRSEGVDLVFSSAGFTLADHVENLTLTGARAIGGVGNAGANQLRGNAGDNSLGGGAGGDLLIGGAGRDRLDGGADSDVMQGGLGDDVFIVDSRLDRVHERSQEGVDLVSSSASFTLSRHVENLTLTGSGAIGGAGNASANQLRGNGAANSLEGAGGADQLFGGKGADRLAGGLDKDQLSGGGGADVFVFDTAADAGSRSKRDVILDFDHGRDVIRLSGIDADASARGNQSFEFIKRASFTGDAGELRYKSGILSGDVTGDGKADFQIALLDAPSLSAGDFIL